MGEDGLGLKVDVDWELEKFEGQKEEGDGKEPIEVLSGGFDSLGNEKNMEITFADGKTRELTPDDAQIVKDALLKMQDAPQEDKGQIVDKLIAALHSSEPQKQEGT